MFIYSENIVGQTKEAIPKPIVRVRVLANCWEKVDEHTLNLPLDKWNSIKSRGYFTL